MATVTKQSYFDTALDLLSTEGYSGLKLATICGHLNVTTGSFYHYFANWKDFNEQFLQDWLRMRTTLLVELARSEADPLERLEVLRNVSLTLPHRAEAAIRVWSNVDPEVRVVQDAADRQRLGVVHDAITELLGDAEEALRYAKWGVYLLVGFEQFRPPDDVEMLDWSLRQLIGILTARRDHR